MDGPFSVRVHTSLAALAESGGGYQCPDCAALACGACYWALRRDPEPDRPLTLTCWLCDAEVRLYLS